MYLPNYKASQHVRVKAQYRNWMCAYKIGMTAQEKYWTINK